MVLIPFRTFPVFIARVRSFCFRVLWYLPALMCAAMMTICAHAQLSESGSYEIRITFENPDPECTLRQQRALTLGHVVKPTSTRSFALHLDDARDAGRGLAKLEGVNAQNWMVSIAFPSTLNNGSTTFPFEEGTWAQSEDERGWTPISGSSYSGTAGGPAARFEHYFNMGGKVSGMVGPTTPKGAYTGTITLTAMCT